MRKAAAVSEEDMDAVRAECEARLGAAERKARRPILDGIRPVPKLGPLCASARSAAVRSAPMRRPGPGVWTRTQGAP